MADQGMVTTDPQTGESTSDGGDRWRRLRETIRVEGRAIIGGEPAKARSGATYADISPIDGSELCHVTDSQPEDIDTAVADARRCWTEGTWRRFDGRAKKRVLRRIADLIREHQDELVLLETLDTGRPIGDSLAVDIPLVADCFEWYAEVVDKRYDEALSTTAENLITIQREPLGVVGALVPWNFPLLMAAWKLAPALAIGNSIVLKPDEKSPLTAIRLAQLALDAGLPPGTLNVCPGHGTPAGEALGRHLDVDCISFTGSVTVGKKLQAYAGQSNMKRVWVETGGKGPQVVLDDVTDLDKVASAVAWGVFYNQGQTCSAGTRLIVHESVHDELVAKVVDLAEGMRVGHPLDPATEIGAVISQYQLDRIHGFCEAARNAGLHVVTGGQTADVVAGGHYYQPTVVTGVRRENEIFQEEVFGPVLAVTSVASTEEAVSAANDSRYGLTAAVWSDGVNTALPVARALRAGTVWVNTFDRADFGVPFGGFGQSGFGRAKSLHAIEKYSDLKSVWIELG